MSVDIVTKEDLQAFREQLVKDIQNLLSTKRTDTKEWLRSAEVRKLLKISPGTLQALRIQGTLRASKVGGLLFYKLSDIEVLLNSGRKE